MAGSDAIPKPHPTRYGHSTGPSEPSGRWFHLAVVSLCVLLVLSPWFSSAAVAPSLMAEWRLSSLETVALTIAVQLGFAVGAVALAASGAADVVPANVLMFGGAMVASVSNLAFGAFGDDVVTALALRAATGLGVAGVYPVGMKVIAGWFSRSRGLAVGAMIGALTIGSAVPYLYRALGTLGGYEWRAIVAAASLGAFAGGLLALFAVREGPLGAVAARFSFRLALQALKDPAVRLANLGYLGHMWELYAMWTWMPAFLVASFMAAGIGPEPLASIGAFTILASGGIGCVVAGALADRLGRTALTIIAMALSGSSAVVVGLLFGGPPVLVMLAGIVWGVTVVADSAQFSTAVTELAPPGTTGSALAVQTAAGFVLTGATITLVGMVGPTGVGSWQLAFALLSIGPVIGILAMWRLRQLPQASRMAGGKL